MAKECGGDGSQLFQTKFIGSNHPWGFKINCLRIYRISNEQVIFFFFFQFFPKRVMTEKVVTNIIRACPSRQRRKIQPGTKFDGACAPRSGKVNLIGAKNNRRKDLCMYSSN